MSAQKENGYTAIANELMEALASYSIPATQMQCLFVVLRDTYGWNRKTSSISLTRFADLTGLDRRHVHRALTELSKKNIIKVEKRSAKDGTKLTSMYRLNKIYTSWVFVPKKARGSAINGTKPSTKDGTDKNNIKQKEKIYKKESLGMYEVAVKIPENYSIQKEHLEYALSKGLSNSQAKDQFEAFKLHFQKTGKKYQSWYATYQTWVRNAIKRGYIKIIQLPKPQSQEDIDKELAEKLA